MAIIGKVSDFTAGKLRGVDKDGTRVAIANVDGRFYAFSDVCTHRGCSLSEGELSGTTVTCYCHGGQFNVTNGEVLGGPPEEALATFAVSQQGDDLVID